jgi:hypothetical protein
MITVSYCVGASLDGPIYVTHYLEEKDTFNFNKKASTSFYADYVRNKVFCRKS